MHRITLTRWCREKYGKHAPCKSTRLRWVAMGKIVPAPIKHGRDWWVWSNARHVDSL